MNKAIAFLLLLAVIFALPDRLHLKKALERPLEALQSLNFTRIVNKWGDIKLHRETEDAEEVIFEENPTAQVFPE